MCVNIKVLSILCLSGCDTVPQMSGIGKRTILKVLRKNVGLLTLGKTMLL